MDFEEWKPAYEAILADFGYDREGDEHARDRLASLSTPFDESLLEETAGATVAVAGAGPSLSSSADLERARDADLVFAASTAADVLEEAGVGVDCMVTDLDKNPETAGQLTHEGTPVAIHAHGDNLAALESVVPDCRDGYVLPTTQAEPREHVVNVGGFTDGDRAAFLADHLGAARLAFVGWDLEDPSVDAEKARKLAWAERLLYWLERRRDEHFSLLDGRRDAIETGGLPLE